MLAISKSKLVGGLNSTIMRFGTRCSSFVWIAAGTSGRRKGNELGDVSKPSVRDGNQQMSITALMMVVAFWCRIAPILEQPTSSVMPKCNPLQSTLSFMKATRVVTWHGSFGARSPKPLQLWSSSDMIKSMRRARPPNAGQWHSLVIIKAGKIQGAKNLKASEAYTPTFGKAVGKMFCERLSNFDEADGEGRPEEQD